MNMVSRTGGMPDLAVLEAGNRLVSRHRWTGAAYATPELKP